MSGIDERGGPTDAGRVAEVDPAFDLEIERVIAASPAVVWAAWTDPEQLSRWWVPAPAVSRVAALEVRPGGSFTTLMAEEPGGEFGPHIDACFLAVDPGERIVFTNALVGGWRPAEPPFLLMTAEITLAAHPLGTLYRARALHRDSADREKHDELGFFEGWGTVTAQLAALVEGPGAGPRGAGPSGGTADADDGAGPRG